VALDALLAERNVTRAAARMSLARTFCMIASDYAHRWLRARLIDQAARI
jgi:hypothetical protein